MPRICAMAPRSCASCTGSTSKRRRASSPRSTPPARSKLSAARRTSCKDLSFPTISAAGPHAAIPHYRVTEASNRRIRAASISSIPAANIEDGTTDITRTLAVGTPTQEMRDRFTRVLKGHIAIARAVFPKGTSGASDRCAGARWPCGRRGSISTTAPATASAPIFRSMRDRSASPKSAAWRWSRA